MLDCRSVVITAVPKDPVFEVYLVSTCFQKILLSYISYVVSTWLFLYLLHKNHLGNVHVSPQPPVGAGSSALIGSVGSLPYQQSLGNSTFLTFRKFFGFQDGWLRYFSRYPWYSFWIFGCFWLQYQHLMLNGCVSRFWPLNLWFPKWSTGSGVVPQLYNVLSIWSQNKPSFCSSLVEHPKKYQPLSSILWKVY